MSDLLGGVQPHQRRGPVDWKATGVALGGFATIGGIVLTAEHKLSKINAEQAAEHGVAFESPSVFTRVAKLGANLLHTVKR